MMNPIHRTSFGAWLPALVFSLFLLLALVPGALPAAADAHETLEDVIARHVAAKGGLEAWDAIESMKVTGEFTAFSKVKPFTLHRTSDDRYRFDQWLGDKTVVTGYDGETFWWDNHWYQEGAQKIKGADLAVVMRDVEMRTPFFDLEKKGHKAELKGKTDLEGIEVIEVDFTRADDSVEKWYLDPETYLEIGRDSPGSDFGSPMEQRTFFDDFREVDGVMIPFFSETQWYTRDRVMEIAAIETNVETSDALFEMPPPIGMGDFQALVGNWIVKVEERQSPRAAWAESEMTSEITPLLRGALIEERFVTGDESEIVRSLSYDRYRERYLFTQINDTSTYLDLQYGAMGEDGRLTVSNLETGTTQQAFGRTIHERTSIFDVVDDGFKVERENSVDGGENWALTQKMTYTRPAAE